MFRASLSSGSHSIQRVGKVDIDFDSFQRVFRGKDSQVHGFLLEAFENPEVSKIARAPFSDSLFFKFFEKLGIRDHFARHKREGSVHYCTSLVALKR
jgi:hypothetical protein